MSNNKYIYIRSYMVIYVYIIEICEVLQIMYYVFSMILFLYYELCLGFYYKPHHHIPIQLAQKLWVSTDMLLHFSVT